MYKSKLEFDRLKRAIKNRETVASLIDVLLLVLFGIIEIVIYIIAFILSRMPVLVALPLHMRAYNYEYTPEGVTTTPESNQLKNAALDSFVFAVVKAFSLIVWYFLSNYFIKQRKVTTVMKIMKWYYAEVFVWLACYAAQTFYACRYLWIMLKHQVTTRPLTEAEKTEDWNGFMTIFGALVILLFLVFAGLSALFLFKLSSYNQGMIDFHKFINSYRQTPRSRNLKKYKPPQEPIYEEMSAFERSHFGSVQVTSEMGSSFHGTQSHRNLIPSSHNGNDTRDGVSVNNVTMSVGGGHQSAIEYNEQLDRFEEVPVDADG